MSEAQYVEMLLERQVSGMIFAGGQYAEADAPHDHYTRLKQLRLPVVLVNAAADNIDFPRVSTDDAVAMEQSHAHLTYLGHERIGLILGPLDHVPSLRKLHAFEQVGARTGSSADRRARRADALLDRGRSLGGDEAARPRCDGDHLRFGPARARARSGPSAAPAAVSRRTCRSSASTTPC